VVNATPQTPPRLERLLSWMESNDTDCLLGVGADIVNYLAGYWRYYGGLSAVAVSRDSARTLVVMHDEVPIAREHASAEDVIGYGDPGFGLAPNQLPLIIEALRSLPALAKAKRVAIAGDGAWDVLREDGHALVDADAALRKLRRVKDADELARLAHAYELCWVAQRAVHAQHGAGLREIELFSEAQRAAQIAHGGPIEFLADLPSGPNTAAVGCPIHVPGARIAGRDDVVVADVCVGADGYWGDSAETHLAVADGEVADARSRLLEILATTATELRPGTTGAEIYADMARRIAQAFPGGTFPHHAGHAVGLSSFEGPHVIPADETPLETSMVLALEPGVYFPGRFGARVENLFIVTAEGGVELRDAFGIPR
jgi:Xaa-Pro aminopeptidase